MILSSHIKKQIKAEYVKERPKECCGLIVSNKGVLTCVPAKNDSLEKDFFRVNPRDYLQASNLGEIVAVYHSHTNGNQNFSEFDVPRGPKATGYVAFSYEHGDRRLSDLLKRSASSFFWYWYRYTLIFN